MSAARLITLGCRLNTFESEIIRDQAAKAGLEDAIVVNTCAVTAEAERQARQTIRKARRDNPSARIIVTGCAAQLHPETFADMDEVDRVLGNAEKLDAEHLGGDAEVTVSDIMAVTETAPHLIEGFDERTRAFVQVQQGCDHRCTFCIIPFARGPNRPVAATAIVDQVVTLTEQGYREVVLTGVDISSYNDVHENSLGALCRRLLAAAPKLERLRLSSLDPAHVDDDVFELLAHEPRMMPHVHLSLQAMDELTLKRMKRRHSPEQAAAVIERIRSARPDTAFGADLIAGFPTETDEMFAATLATVRDLAIPFLHVFPYSPRQGTPAAKMPQTPKATAKDRAAQLRAIGETALQDFLATRVGTQAAVLIEQGRKGRTEHFAPITVDFDADAGTIVACTVTGIENGHLIGTKIS